MSNVVRKVRCPGGRHEDKTPSCAVYANGSGYCFSCCSYFKDIAEPVAEQPKESENLRDKFIYIDSLSRMDHRGLNFHFDSRGYYITWPLQDYYKLRLWAPREGESKYIGAKGHKKPWYVLRAYKKVNTCVLVEGEINAMSIASVISELDVLSPGGATNFYDSEMKNRVDVFSNYDTLLVLVDNDDAGNKAALEFHKLAKPHCLDIRIKLLEKGKDCNEILINHDKEELRKLIMDM